MNEWIQLREDLERYLMRQSMTETELSELSGSPLRLQDTEPGKLLKRLKTRTSREFLPGEAQNTASA